MSNRRYIITMYVCSIGITACTYAMWHLMTNSEYTKPNQWVSWYILCGLNVLIWSASAFSHYDVRQRKEKDGDSCETKQ